MVAGLALLGSGVALGAGAVCATALRANPNDLFALYITGCVLTLLGYGALAASSRSKRALATSMPNEEGPTRRTSAAERRNLEGSVATSNAQIATQFATSAGLEAQLVGLLGFLATAGTIFAVVKHALGSDRVILLAGISAAAVVCLLGSFLPKELEAGPLASRSFDEFGGADAGFSLQLLGDLTATIVHNDRALGQRRGALNAVLVLLVVAVAVFAFARLWLLIE